LFGDAIGDLGYLELGIDFRADAFELIAFLKQGDEFSEVFDRHSVVAAD
jgi:hypothetical protein